MISLFVLCLSAPFFFVAALSECRDGRSQWSPPLWRGVQNGRTVAFVLAVAPLDVPDDKALDAFQAAAAVDAVHYMRAVDAPAVDCTVSLQSDPRLAALIARLEALLKPDAFAELFGAWRTTPLAVLAHRLSVFASVLWSVSANVSASAVGAVLADSQLTPSTFVERLLNATKTTAARVPLESPLDVCSSTVEPYESPAVKQAALDLFIPELDAVILRSDSPPRAARNAELSLAYRCGDVDALVATYARIGTTLWHAPLNGSAAEQLTEKRLFARNRRVARAVAAAIAANGANATAPLFVVDAANLLAADPTPLRRPTLKAELEALGLQLRLVPLGGFVLTDAPVTAAPPGSDPNTVVYSVVGVLIFALVGAIAAAVWFTLKQRRAARH